MTAPPLLSMEGIAKSYPGVQALAGVNLALGRGEVLALLGCLLYTSPSPRD